MSRMTFFDRWHCNEHNGNAHYVLSVLLVLVIASSEHVTVSSTESVEWVEYYNRANSVSWLLLLIMHSWVIKKQNWRWHRPLSLFSMLLGGLLIHAQLLKVHLTLNSQTVVAQRFSVIESFAGALSIMLFSWLLIWAHKHHRFGHQYANCIYATALIFITPALLSLINFWVPGLKLISLEQYIPNYTLAQCVSMLICLILIFKAHADFLYQWPFIVAIVVMAIQLLGIHMIGQGSPWALLMAHYAEVDANSIHILCVPLGFLPVFLSYRARRLRD